MSNIWVYTLDNIEFRVRFTKGYYEIEVNNRLLATTDSLNNAKVAIFDYVVENQTEDTDERFGYTNL